MSKSRTERRNNDLRGCCRFRASNNSELSRTVPCAYGYCDSNCSQNRPLPPPTSRNEKRPSGKSVSIFWHIRLKRFSSTYSRSKASVCWSDNFFMSNYGLKNFLNATRWQHMQRINSDREGLGAPASVSAPAWMLLFDPVWACAMRRSKARRHRGL